MTLKRGAYAPISQVGKLSMDGMRRKVKINNGVAMSAESLRSMAWPCPPNDWPVGRRSP